jgi:dTDP-4-amino-4,6-dideoxygalactose transaminase
MTATAAIPVLVPHLPRVDQLLPYLDRIDRNHIYSNYGPLAREFSKGLAGRFFPRSGQVGVTLTSSGTTAIELALRVRAKRDRRYCLMPAYTFIATAHAVINANLQPFLTDVDERSLMLTPEIAIDALKRMPEPPGAVLVVSPFGASPELSAWEKFEQQTEIPVVFDAAASAASIREVGHQPQCVSLHATKVLGIGEGGAILCTDADLIANTTAMTGFGFTGSARTSVLRGGNYRLSEYASAIGLAALANLDDTIDRLRQLTAKYQNGLLNLDLRLQDGVGTSWVTMTLNVILPFHRVEATKARFEMYQIGWRHWWGMGCHTHPAFADLPSTDLPVTSGLAPRVLGVPFHEQLTDEQIDLVCDCLR